MVDGGPIMKSYHHHDSTRKAFRRTKMHKTIMCNNTIEANKNNERYSHDSAKETITISTRRKILNQTATVLNIVPQITRAVYRGHIFPIQQTTLRETKTCTQIDCQNIIRMKRLS